MGNSSGHGAPYLDGSVQDNYDAVSVLPNERFSESQEKCYNVRIFAVYGCMLLVVIVFIIGTIGHLISFTSPTWRLGHTNIINFYTSILLLGIIVTLIQSCSLCCFVPPDSRDDIYMGIETYYYTVKKKNVKTKTTHEGNVTHHKTTVTRWKETKTDTRHVYFKDLRYLDNAKGLIVLCVISGFILFVISALFTGTKICPDFSDDPDKCMSTNGKCMMCYDIITVYAFDSNQTCELTSRNCDCAFIYENDCISFDGCLWYNTSCIRQCSDYTTKDRCVTLNRYPERCVWINDSDEGHCENA